MKLTLRDLFWLVLVVGMGCAWWIESSRSKLDPTSQYKAWGFDIAAQILDEKTGEKMTADKRGVTVASPPTPGESRGTATVYGLGSELSTEP